MNDLKKIFFTFLFLLPIFIYPQVGGKYYFERKDSIKVTQNSAELQFPWVGGLNAIQVSKINLNEDAHEDLFIFDRTGNTILTFVWNDSENQWKYAPEYESQFPKLEYWALLRDYNCDGKKDIFAYVSGGIGVWKNISSNGVLGFEYVSDPYVYSSLFGGTVANLYVSKVDIPDINDVDGDGDLDVLTFSILGDRIEFHQNMSIELGYGCDSLKYEVANMCWGHFLETGVSTNACILLDTCGTNVANPKGLKHAGSTVLSLDLNDDGVKDLLLGDVSFNNIVALYNDNKGVNMNTSMTSQDTAFPDGTIPVDIYTFPASFSEDVDNDGIKDLIFSTNNANGTENHNSSWFYKNFGTNSDPVFAHIQKNWLQDEMIEVGKNAYPVLFDYNGDGRLDLFVGNFGYFGTSFTNNYLSKITLYENTGTNTVPHFTFVTDDFANISSLGFPQGIIPTFGDIDDDGDIDMIIGDYNGRLHVFSNSSNSLNSMSLTLTTTNLTDDNGTTIDVGYSAKPILYDLDKDGKLDLIIGEENGNLNYYQNQGTTLSPDFRLQSETFGDVDVSEWWTTVGNSTPFIFENDLNETQLFVGSQNGYIIHYTDLDGNLGGNFIQWDTLAKNVHAGTNASPTFGDLNNDGYVDLIVGNERGGLSIFYGTLDTSSDIEKIEENLEIHLFPNPTNGILNIATDFDFETYAIYDCFGKLIQNGNYRLQIDLSNFENGIYLIQLASRNEFVVKKIIKNDQ